MVKCNQERVHYKATVYAKQCLNWFPRNCTENHYKAIDIVCWVQIANTWKRKKKFRIDWAVAYCPEYFKGYATRLLIFLTVDRALLPIHLFGFCVKITNESLGVCYVHMCMNKSQSGMCFKSHLPVRQRNQWQFFFFFQRLTKSEAPIVRALDDECASHTNTQTSRTHIQSRSEVITPTHTFISICRRLFKTEK